MTNEEAIRFGKCILMVADDKSDSTTIEFTKLALKALEQGDVLREIRQEIAEYHAHNGNGDDRSIDCRLFNAGIQIALEIIDKKISEG